MSRAADSDRIGGLDLARGLAVLGMFGAHLDIGAELTTDPSTWAAVVDGRSSVLFATLAGVSIALLSGRTRPAGGVELVQARLRITVRAAWVFPIGAVLEWLDTFVAIILGVYAVLFVLALPFLRWPSRRLFVLAGVVAVAGPPLDAFPGQVLSVADAESHYVAELLITGSYPALLWLAFVLVGLGVGRLDPGAVGVRIRLAACGAAAAVLGYGGGPGAARGVGAWLMLSLAALSVASVWRWKLGRGPLERLLTWSSTRAAAVEPASST